MVQDHFAVMPLDHGRCHSMARLTHDDFEDMFVIQLTGDLNLLDFETNTWRCYHPGRDIVIPSQTEEDFTINDVVRPNSTERNITALYRFGGGGRGSYSNLRTQVKAGCLMPLQHSFLGGTIPLLAIDCDIGCLKPLLHEHAWMCMSCTERCLKYALRLAAASRLLSPTAQSSLPIKYNVSA